MRVLTRFAPFLLVIGFAFLSGCSKSGGNSGTNPPQNQPPTVQITSNTPDSIYYNETIEFTWQGDDPEGELDGYYAGLDGNFQYTDQTSAEYSGFSLGETHNFFVYAEDSQGATSDTAEVTFAIYPYSPPISLDAEGEGVTDDDNDGYWTQFDIRWYPDVPTGSPVDLYLKISLQPSYGGGTVFMDSSDVVSRAPGATDTLTFTLPAIPKNIYDIRLELYDLSGTLLQAIDYGVISSLTQVGLEPYDGFFAWFDDAWTDDAVDTNQDGYYESIELWWDADANPDAGWVKVVVYERNSSGDERQIWEHYPYEIEGLGDEDANGITITAGTTFDTYDYRLELLSTDNEVLDLLNYGDDPDLMDIPLGNSGGLHQKGQITQIRP